eukprot:342893-Chlamydomonas_euryale.AAC.2
MRRGSCGKLVRYSGEVPDRRQRTGTWRWRVAARRRCWSRPGPGYWLSLQGLNRKGGGGGGAREE